MADTSIGQRNRSAHPASARSTHQQVRAPEIQADPESDTNNTRGVASSEVTPGRKRPSSQVNDSDDDSESVFGLGPRKRPCKTDPLVRHGRHFGRAVMAFCRVYPLIKEGMALSFQIEIEEITPEEMVPSTLWKYQVYQQLLALSPGLEKRLCTATEEFIFHVADLIQKGSAGARADDTKGLKGVVLDWITPRGQCLQPPLMRNVMTDRGFFHDRTGELLCPVGLNFKDPNIREGLRNGSITVTGDEWPVFLYANNTYNPNDIWEGLFRSKLLVSAFKHIFTSPSSVDTLPRATRSGNARIHGMEKVTVASLAYVATQLRFTLSSSPVFARTDLVTDSENFYGTVIKQFNKKQYLPRVADLLKWWDKQVFPTSHHQSRTLKKGCVLALMDEQYEIEARQQSAERASGSATVQIQPRFTLADRTSTFNNAG